MRTIIGILLTSLFLTSCGKHNEPVFPGHEAVAFFGKNSSDASFQDFIKQHKFFVRNNGVGDDAYENNGGACSFGCHSNSISSVGFLRADYYESTLPYELEWSDTPEDVIKKLGKPVMDGIGKGIDASDPDRRIMDYDRQNEARLVIQFIEKKMVQLHLEKR